MVAHFFYLLPTESDNDKSTDDQGSIAVEELEVSEVLSWYWVGIVYLITFVCLSVV